MAHEYDTHSTSNRSAVVHDIWLNPPENQEDARTRRVLQAEVVDNIHNESARIKICLTAQKRHTNKAPWQSVDCFNLAHLKAGEEVRLRLDSAETYELWKELERLYELASDGVPRGERSFVVADKSDVVVARGTARVAIERLIAQGDEELWDVLAELQPNLFKAIALTKLHEVREQAVEDFSAHVASDDWSEEDWQNFFERNTWIFGYGLSYKFLSGVQTQPHYGGTTLSGVGGQKGDFLRATQAERRFSVLVEIKKPSTTLVSDKLYRNKVLLLGGELAGGVTQVQSNCRTWEMYGAQQEENRETLEDSRIATISPKGILIIGHTKQLNTKNKQITFELFRRNLHNPEVITFDELLERARHLLLNEKREILPT